MATHSSILAWRIPWREEPGELQFIGSQKVRHDCSEVFISGWSSQHILTVASWLRECSELTYGGWHSGVPCLAPARQQGNSVSTVAEYTLMHKKIKGYLEDVYTEHRGRIVFFFRVTALRLFPVSGWDFHRNLQCFLSCSLRQVPERQPESCRSDLGQITSCSTQSLPKPSHLTQ